MPKRSRKPRKDANQIAAQIVGLATQERERPKNPAAVALGRLGGQKGGKARASKLSARRRTEIARKAARVRWQAKAPQGM